MAIDEVISQVLAERKLDIKRKKIILNQTIGNVFIVSNRKQMAVILDNILSNAIKYSPDGGTIEISTALANQQLQILINDQGVGIPPEEQDKIFDAFYQGPPPKNSAIKGSGLGLTIVKELLLRLNGSIELISPQGNQTGTHMKITLPRAFRQEKQV